ncbi:MAG: hypothetical protein ACR2NF_12215 [Pirellulales bacterium]
MEIYAPARKWAVLRIALSCLLFSMLTLQLFAVPSGLVKKVALKGVKLVVRNGDEAIRYIDDVTKVSSSVLREALEDIDDVTVFAKIAKSRFPGEVSERTLKRLQSVTDDLASINGAKSVMKLLVSDSRSQVKGAVGELGIVAVLCRRKNITVTGMRDIVETSLGKTDIDVAFSYGDIPVLLERKNINRLPLTSELKLKIDKFSELANTRDAVAMISAGEIKPTQAVLDYASTNGVTVIHGGLLTQFQMAERALKKVPVLAIP